VLAGHPPAYHIHHGLPRAVGVLAPLLGVSDCHRWSAATVDLEPGDQFVLYTDGVIDTVGETERFGEDRLAATLIGVADAADTVRRIEEAITGFARGQPVDDTAVVVVERTPE
jgi:serine phosphatase RsbU (regulator of sigma subunit)